MSPRPDACRGCPLDSNPKTQGFAPAVGPTNASICFVGEALGEEEARTGIPFSGAAGGMLNRLLTRNHWDRNQFRIANTISCRPPNNWFDERAPWYWGARNHCAVHRDPVFAEGHKVIVPLGGTALKLLLGIDKGIRVEDWHGTVTPTKHGLIVPTYHPSHLQRGAHNLFGVVSFDLQQAMRVANEGWTQETPDIIVDPPLDWATWWVGQVEAAAIQDPDAVWLTVDIETPDKSSGQDEGELTAEDRSYTILRVNFSVHPDEGVTFPYTGPYVALIDRLLKLPCVKTGWNFEYDRPRILAAGHTINGIVIDGMWYAHFLQSDIPRGLGFWAPMYSIFGAWKHKAISEPGYYAACDGFQNYRTVDGIARHLQQLGMWDRAFSHITQLHDRVLKPAQAVGIKIDRQALIVFIADLEQKQKGILAAMQGMVPDAVRPLTPKGGLKRAPEEGKVHAKSTGVKRDGTAKKEQPDEVKAGLYANARIVARTVQMLVYVCRTCGAVDVATRHQCVGRGGGADGSAPPPDLVFEERPVPRWFWQEPFNPDSPPQILAYLAHRKHKPGRAKKTGADSTDRDTLTWLYRETKDPLYKAILDSRAVGKVKGTYGVGTLKRLDGEDRVHPTPCLTGEHEVLTPQGWLRLDALMEGTAVTQWNVKNGELSFVSPIGITRVPYTGNLRCLRGPRIALDATPTHRVVYHYYASGKRRYTKVGTADTLPLVALIPCTGTLAGPRSWNTWVALAIAIAADGAIRSTTVRLGLTRQRKQIRIRQLLTQAGVQWTERAVPTPTGVEICFTFRRAAVLPALAWLLDYDPDRKTLDLQALLQLDVQGKTNFVEEVTRWDGHRGKYRAYFSVNYTNADTVRTMAHLCGQTASITTRPAAERLRPYHVVTISYNDTQGRALERFDRPFTGIVYCVTVPTEFFLVRYGDRVSITGNTFRPSTMRLSYVDPNITNVVADKGEDERASLASGFRNVVVSAETLPGWVTPEGLVAWEARWTR